MPFATQTFDKKKAFLEPVEAKISWRGTLADVSALKSKIEGEFSVVMTIEGLAPDFTVTVKGPKRVLEKAMSSLAPQGRSDITVQKAKFHASLGLLA